eukprot:TRINITY_DN9312_c0_g1_i1.p1 TRINITY_DN9312_c0_g1~~TRINITY_DN9312_c0_g1_i1.p1  ORF type:complete len:165 (-),score=42.91 TRINITY_DN9312_c0_g1_i1:293-787(-)
MILESPGDVKLFCSALGNMQDLRYLDLSGFAAPPNSHTSSFGLLGKALSKLRGLQEFRMADPGLNLMATAFGNARHWRLIAEPLAAMSELQLVDITGSVRTMADSDEFSRNVVTSEGAKKWAENMYEVDTLLPQGVELLADAYEETARFEMRFSMLRATPDLWD